MKPRDIRKAGLKITTPRVMILGILENSAARHMTADDIYRTLVQKDEDIGLATVYRVLNQFDAAGLVTKHNFEGGQAFYEIDHGSHHDHMVCVETGDVIEFFSAEIEALQTEVANKQGYEIEDHSLVLYVRPKKD